jgi:hypothetical protein
MAYREFLDSNGVSWRVWSTVPSAGTRLRGGFDQGWLTFERTTHAERMSNLRRLVPIPADWETAPDAQLELLCRSADAVFRPRQGRDQSASVESPEQP